MIKYVVWLFIFCLIVFAVNRMIFFFMDFTYRDAWDFIYKRSSSIEYTKSKDEIDVEKDDYIKKAVNIYTVIVMIFIVAIAIGGRNI